MLTMMQLREELVELCKQDLDERETHGKNRSPMIDAVNKRLGVPMGSPYCIGGILVRGVEVLCKKHGLKNPVKMTAGTQNFYREMESFHESEGQMGDIAIMRNRSDKAHGHAWLVLKKSDAKHYEALEYNTDLAGDRDGDGVYKTVRSSDGDKSKEHRGFVDAIRAIVAANPEHFEQPKQEVLPSDLPWGNKRDWTKHLRKEIEASKLPDLNPIGATEMHPKFASFTREQKVSFYMHLISMMAKFESSWNPKTTYQEPGGDAGPGTLSIGLMQVSVEDDANYRLKMGLTKAKLQDPLVNLTVAVKIMSAQVSKHNQLLGQRNDGKWLGASSYWSVMRPVKKGKPRESFEKIKAHTRSLKF